MQIYHQLGHNSKWNIDAWIHDGVGSGVIIAPRHMKRQDVEGYGSAFKRKAIFDPQFFIPGNPHRNLATYDFYPGIVADGFDTSEYPNEHAHISAERCVAFQLSQDFRYLIIPTRHMSSMPENFQELQQQFSVDPFLDQCAKQGVDIPVMLQLILNEHMLRNKNYLNQILNWVTGISGIDGVYLIAERPKQPKQVKDPTLLGAILNVIDILKQNELIVAVGYVSIESFLLSIADPDIVTIGSYETTRIFDIANFREKPKQPFSPTPRIYSPKLLQLVEHPYVEAIRSTKGFGLEELFEMNDYRAKMFASTYQWNSNKEEVYRDYFLVFSQQLAELSSFQGAERYAHVVKVMETAREWFTRVEQAGIILEFNSDGSHLPSWLTAAHQFAVAKGWR